MITFEAGSKETSQTAPLPIDQNNDLSALISDGAGGWYVGQSYTTARTGVQVVRHLAQNGTLDTAFNPASIKGSVYALQLAGDHLCVAGFLSINGGTQTHTIAVLHKTTGALVSHIDADGFIATLAASDETLYAAGAFTHIADVDRVAIAAFHTTGDNAWTPISTFTPPEFLSDSEDNQLYYILSIAITNDRLYVSGDLRYYTIDSTHEIAALDKTDGELKPLPTDIHNTYYNYPKLLIHGSNLYIFSQGSQIATFNTDTESFNANAFECNFKGLSKGIILSNTLYASCGSSKTLSAFNIDTKAASDNVPFAERVEWFASHNNTIAVGGSFKGIGGISKPYLQAWDLQGAPKNVSLPTLTTEAAHLFLKGSVLFVAKKGTDSSKEGSDPDENAFIAWDLAKNTVSSVWENKGCKGTVYALTANSTTLYVAGHFTTCNGTTRSQLAAFDLATGQLLDWNPQLPEDSNVHMINATETVVFLISNGDTLYGAHPQTGALLQEWNGIFTEQSSIYGIDAANEKLYLVGNFEFSSDPEENRTSYYFAILDIKAQKTLSRTVLPTESKFSGYAVRIQGNKAYVARSQPWLLYDNSESISKTTFTAWGNPQGPLEEKELLLYAFDATTGARDTAWNPQVTVELVSIAIHSNGTLFGVSYKRNTPLFIIPSTP